EEGDFGNPSEVSRRRVTRLCSLDAWRGCHGDRLANTSSAFPRGWGFSRREAELQRPLHTASSWALAGDGQLVVERRHVTGTRGG
ncbi:MAG: hypothetical protein ACK41W_12105, partial [Cyanobacteriota bacterium]